MKPGSTTDHCIDKLRYLRRLGLYVYEEVVIKVVQYPQLVNLCFGNRLIAQSALDDEHVLRAIYD